MTGGNSGGVMRGGASGSGAGRCRVEKARTRRPHSLDANPAGKMNGDGLAATEGAGKLRSLPHSD